MADLQEELALDESGLGVDPHRIALSLRCLRWSLKYDPALGEWTSPVEIGRVSEREGCEFTLRLMPQGVPSIFSIRCKVIASTTGSGRIRTDDWGDFEGSGETGETERNERNFLEGHGGGTSAGFSAALSISGGGGGGAPPRPPPPPRGGADHGATSPPSPSCPLPKGSRWVTHAGLWPAPSPSRTPVRPTSASPQQGPGGGGAMDRPINGETALGPRRGGGGARGPAVPWRDRSRTPGRNNHPRSDRPRS